MSVNFKVIENYDDGVDYDELKKDYFNPDLCVKQICEKWGISLKSFSKYRKLISEETGVKRRKSNCNGKKPMSYDDRYIFEYSDGYHIKKTIDGLLWTFGIFSSLELAREKRQYFEEMGWFDYDYN